MVKQIPLSRGVYAVVDDVDFAWLSQWKWHCTKIGYAARTIRSKDGGKKKCIYMHRLIMDAQPGFEIDHIDGDTLNNQRGNLRQATYGQNKVNTGLRRTNTSGYKGVVWHKQCLKWKAEITINSKNRHLGLFSTKEEAAKAYDKAALENFGEFARLNFPEVS
jgi:hypothetical protein